MSSRPVQSCGFSTRLASVLLPRQLSVFLASTASAARRLLSRWASILPASAEMQLLIQGGELPPSQCGHVASHPGGRASSQPACPCDFSARQVSVLLARRVSIFPASTAMWLPGWGKQASSQPVQPCSFSPGGVSILPASVAMWLLGQEGEHPLGQCGHVASQPGGQMSFSARRVSVFPASAAMQLLCQVGECPLRQTGERLPSQCSHAPSWPGGEHSPGQCGHAASQPSGQGSSRPAQPCDSSSREASVLLANAAMRLPGQVDERLPGQSGHVASQPGRQPFSWPGGQASS